MEKLQLPIFSKEQVETLQQAFECFKKAVIKSLEVLSKAFKEFNIDENFIYNFHMAKYSKKKRIRKKYLKKLMK